MEKPGQQASGRLQVLQMLQDVDVRAFGVFRAGVLGGYCWKRRLSGESRELVTEYARTFSLGASGMVCVCVYFKNLRSVRAGIYAVVVIVV